MPLISLIVTTYKATAHLRCLTASLLRAHGRDAVEVVIYGDGGGSDSEQAIAECAASLSQNGYTVRAHYCPTNRGIVPALNAACVLATGDWLLIMNDDMVFSAGWFDAVTFHLKPNRVLSLTAAEPPLPGRHVADCFFEQNLGLNPDAFDFDNLEAFARKNNSTKLEVGVNYPFLVERRHYSAVGGADERFVGPYHDPDLFHRFGLAELERVRLKACLIYHFSGISLRFEQGANSIVALAKLNKKSANWITRENHARLTFIRKWGCKPKARYGYIPEIRATEPWDSRSRSLADTLRFRMLLLWEQLRCVWRAWMR
jgi:glycosyltransferase involved in cell wall biosynthesis